MGLMRDRPPPGPSVVPVLLGGMAVLMLTLLLASLRPAVARATPGLCVGPVCGDQITRSAKHHWQLRFRLDGGGGLRERVSIDCRTGRVSPESGRIDRRYAAAVGRRACRLVQEA
jgi:hypothetical protein